jgi:hypothetical protein
LNCHLIQRVRDLRGLAGLTRAGAAKALGIPLPSYQHFENRSPLPAHLIAPFGALVDRDIGFVLTGEPDPSSRRPGSASPCIGKAGALGSLYCQSPRLLPVT